MRPLRPAELGGEYGGASLWSHEERATEEGVLRAQFTVNDGRESRAVDAAYLFETPAR